MKRLKRALSLTKSAPRIEESIAEIDEHSIKDSFLDPLNESPNGGIQFKTPTSCNGNNNKSNSTNNGKHFLVCWSCFLFLLAGVLVKHAFSKMYRQSSHLSHKA